MCMYFLNRPLLPPSLDLGPPLSDNKVQNRITVRKNLSSNFLDMELELDTSVT